VEAFRSQGKSTLTKKNGLQKYGLILENNVQAFDHQNIGRNSNNVSPLSVMSSGRASNGLRSTRIGYLGTLQDVSSVLSIDMNAKLLLKLTTLNKSIFRIFCVFCWSRFDDSILNHFFIYIARTRPFLVWSYPRRSAQAPTGNRKKANPEVPQKLRSLELFERPDGSRWSTKRDQCTKEKTWCLAC